MFVGRTAKPIALRAHRKSPRKALTDPVIMCECYTLLSIRRALAKRIIAIPCMQL